MPSADVVVVGAGLAGLTAAHRARGGRRARRRSWPGATPRTHWAAGGIDVAAPPDDARTPAEGVDDAGRACPATRTRCSARTSRRRSTGSRASLAEAGLPYAGDARRRRSGRVPTAIGGDPPGGDRARGAGRGAPAVGAGRAARRRRAGRVQGLLAGRGRGQPRRGDGRVARRRRPARRGSWASPSSCRASRAAATSTRSTSPAFDDPRAARRGPRRDRGAVGRAAGGAAGPGRAAGGPRAAPTTPRRWADARARARRSTRSRSRSSRRASRACGCTQALRAALRARRRPDPGRRAGRAGSRSPTAGVVAVELDGRDARPPDPDRRASSSRPAGSPAAGSSARPTAGSWSRCSGCRSRRRRQDDWLRREAVRPGRPPARGRRHPHRRAAPPARRRRPGRLDERRASSARSSPASATCASGAATASRSPAGWRAAATILDGPPAAAETADARRRVVALEERPPDDDRRPRRARRPPSSTGHVSSSADECLKCNVCNTVCPVARVTDLFPGPKYVGPQAQRFRLARGQPIQGPVSTRLASPDRLGRLLLRLRLVHDRLPGRT